MVRHTRQFWEKLVGELSRGAALDIVAARHDVRPRTLAVWRRSLAREVSGRPTPRLLPVALPAEPFVEKHPNIVIDLKAGVIRVDVGTNPEYVAALVRALRD